MAASNRLPRVALVLGVGTALLVATSSAEAQRRREPRIGVAAPPRQEPRPTDPRYPSGSYGSADPRRRADQWQDDRYRNRRSRGPTVIYVPVPAGYGYGYAYDATISGMRPYGGVTDANGRPLTASDEPLPSAGGYGYTPDLSGFPYRVSDEGMMVVDFDSGQPRAFPSCALTEDQRDPQGRPRTIFYRSPDYWMILRPGQRGRVHGEPPAGTAACYAIDSAGRVVLRY